MKLWALEYYTGDDECECRIFIGVFLTETDALGGALVHFEDATHHRPLSLDDYRAYEIEVGVLKP